MEQDPTLIETGIESKMILATPTTLIGLLNAEPTAGSRRGSAKMLKISFRWKELYKRLADMGVHFSRLGKSLESSVEAYNKTIGSMESRLLVTARRFKELETGENEELQEMEPVEKSPRALNSPEMKQE